MSERTVTDSAGRAWVCTPVVAPSGSSSQGRDVSLSCVTATVESPVSIMVGWQWESMAAPGLARLLTTASPVPKQ